MKLATTKLFTINPRPEDHYDVTHAGLGPHVWNWLTRYGITFKATTNIALTEDELTDDNHKREAKKARREVEEARIPSPACSETLHNDPHDDNWLVVLDANDVLFFAVYCLRHILACFNPANKPLYSA